MDQDAVGFFNPSPLKILCVSQAKTPPPPVIN